MKSKADRDLLHRLYVKHYGKKKPDPVAEKVRARRAKLPAPPSSDELRLSKLRELDLRCSKYKHYVKSSVRRSPDGIRFDVTIKCKCGKTATCHTQDLFQVTKCEECKKKGKHGKN